MTSPGDAPIQGPSEDRLGRSVLASSLAKELLALDAKNGAVAGVIGPWGSGKTSLLNIARAELAPPATSAILSFNPWLVSGTEQLVEHFFRELAAQLREPQGRLSTIADRLEEYGSLVAPLSVPLEGGVVAALLAVYRAFRARERRRRGSLLAQRENISKLLVALDRPIIVIIDDIDRLSREEMRDVFRLVRLVANFPQVIYLLAFDRGPVEAALTEQGMEGRAYLEKIVQVTVEIPEVSLPVMVTQLTGALDAGLSEFGKLERFDEERWPDVLFEIVVPLVRNLRDVYRLVASTRISMRSLKDQIDAVDIIALDAVRLLAPEIFRSLVAARAPLTSTAEYYREEPHGHRELIERVCQATPTDESVGVGRALVARLFPAGLRYVNNTVYGPDFAPEWLRERRAAHPDILALYLERAAGESLQNFELASEAVSHAGDAAELEEYLQRIEVEKREDVIAGLAHLTDDVPENAIPDAVVALLNVLPTLPEREQGLYTLPPTISVGRAVLFLLRRPDDAERVTEIVNAVLPRLRSISSRAELIRIVGHREGSGHRLVSENTASELEVAIHAEVRAADQEQLAREWNALELLYRSRTEADAPGLLAPVNPALTTSLLLQARRVGRSQAMDSRYIQREVVLTWDALVQVFGSEEALAASITAAADAALGAEADNVIALAKRYLDGWRPARD